MKSPIRLTRTIALQEWRITGTLAVATRREWEPALLKLTEQHEWLTPELVVDQLLGGRQGIARRLLDICTALRLLEPRRDGWRATEAGKLAATTSMVLLPQRGLWTVWTADDPLLRHGVIAVDSWKDEPSAFDERGAHNGRRQDEPRSFKPLPGALTGALDKVLDVPAGPLRAIRIDDLGDRPHGEPVRATTAKARITWTLAPGESRCRLTGQAAGHPIDADVPAPALTHEQVWQSLLRHAHLESQWDPHLRTLRVSFEAANDEERARMTRALRITGPCFGELGSFDDTTVDPVALQACSRGDATAWARWRLFRALTTYASDGALEQAYRQAAEPFDGMAAACPSRAELIAMARGDGRPPPSFWWLQAPTDWSQERSGIQ